MSCLLPNRTRVYVIFHDVLDEPSLKGLPQVTTECEVTIETEDGAILSRGKRDEDLSLEPIYPYLVKLQVRPTDRVIYPVFFDWDKSHWK